jgi:hypothetical protein
MNEEISPEEYAAMQSDMQGSEGFVEFAELMVEDPKIPEKASKDFWGFLNKETILSRTDTNDRRRSENRFAIQRNLNMMSMPHYKVDINKLKMFQNIQQRNTTEVNRSYGGFERDRLAMQIREIRTNKSDTSDGGNSFWKGIKKKFGIGGDERADSS